MPQFYTLLTDTGQAKLANAVALGGTIEITELAVGDGGGSLPTPSSSATVLVNELRRAPINTSQTDPDNPSWIVVEQVLPPDVGGWTIREIGIIDADGDLIGIGNYPETYKPVLAEGSSRTQTVRFVLEVSDTAAVTLKVDPSVVLATREHVAQERAEHEASRSHPLATPDARGMVEKATKADLGAGAADKFPDAKELIETLGGYGVGKKLRRLIGTLDNPIFNGAGFAPGDDPDSPFSSGSGIEAVTVLDQSNLHGFQLIFSQAAGQAQYRTKSSGVWLPWRKIYDSNTFPKATTAEATSGAADKYPDAASAKAAIDARVADQSTVDAGTNDTRFVTPKKLKAWVKQATESVMGLVKLSTQAQTDAGDDDNTAVTPKKLRWGVSYDFSANGYLVLPSWLGGFIFQWGEQFIQYDGTRDHSGTVSYPISFTVGALAVLANGQDVTNNYYIVAARPDTVAQFEYTYSSIQSNPAGSGSNNFTWFAVGR